MNLLLDTHTFLWFAFTSMSSNLPVATKNILADPSNNLYLSPASAWELAIKISKGKLSLPLPVKQTVDMLIAKSLLNLLPIKTTHIELIETMPFHHNDPFDRLLIAQAMAESFTIVSIDAAFDRYGVSRLWRV
jgi:PIN domain nuclease of toxin-antitoxin system